MSKKFFDNKMQSLLNLLVEEEIKNKVLEPQQPIVATQQKQDPGLQIAGKAKFQYLATNVMYYKEPPIDSSTWPEEKKQKIWLLPLMDGRIMNALAKAMGKSFTLDRNARHGAARYRPYQFRIIIRGTLIADVEFEGTKGEGDVIFFGLSKLEVTTPYAGKITVNKGDSLLRGKKVKFKIKEKISKELDDELEDSEDSENSEDSDIQLDIIGAAKAMGADKKLASKFAKWAMKNFDIKTDKDIAQITAKYFSSFAKGKYKNNLKPENLNLQNYLNKLLVEIKKETSSGKYSKKEVGGEITKDSVAHQIGHMIDQAVLANIFKENGLTCKTDNRLFEGTILEFFATKSASFDITDFTVEASNKTKKFIAVGKLKMNGEAWFDARVGETNQRFDTWTFRVHDRPDRFFLQKKYGALLTRGTEKQQLEPKTSEGGTK